MSRAEPASDHAPPALRPPSDALGTYPRALVGDALDRLLKSDVFRRSERHRRLMHHLVQSTLDGHADRLKEVLLGLDLFDRHLDRYDPRSDPVVRVEVGRLREKLARYYASEGALESFAFAIPVGAYVPRFDRRPPAARVVRAVASYAVLPFANGGDDDAAFAIGLADQLIHVLGRVPDVKVVARASAFEARARQLDVRAAGKLLNVTRVIDGSIQRHGSRLRCIAQIVDVRAGVLVWSQAFDAQTDPAEGGAFDLFAFQDRIAAALCEAAVPVASKAPPAPASGAMQASLERRTARDLFERANYLLRRYDAALAGKVIDLLERSVALDPDHVRALLALAKAYVDEIALLNVSPMTLLPKIEAVVERALVLDPVNSDALSLRAAVAHRFHHDWPKAERLYVDALELTPHSITAHYRYAGGLVFNGRFDEALHHLRIAIDLDPLFLGLRVNLVPFLIFARDYRQAEDEARAIFEIEPGHVYLHVIVAQLRFCQRRIDDAKPHIDRVVAAIPGHPAPSILRVCALGLGGDRAGGERELEAVLSTVGTRYVSPFYLAMARLCLGDREAALAALEAAAVGRDPLFESLPVDPLFAPLHDDPAFLALLARHGLREPVRF